ncbi:hypothetical protein BJV78DRAFT_86522 [Lactifluus subvellereus]|nr:hypothetical protein BJV78DRAFT_86522 [Lactifluus subvellereus]
MDTMAASRSEIRMGHSAGRDGPKASNVPGRARGQRVSPTGWGAPEEGHTKPRTFPLLILMRSRHLRCSARPRTTMSAMTLPSAPHTRSCSPRHCGQARKDPAAVTASGRGGAVRDASHLLLVRSHYSMLLCLLLLGDFPALLRAFVCAATIIDGLESYPIFLLRDRRWADGIG